MKIIISTKHLSSVVREAIIYNCMSFTVIVKTSEIVFSENNEIIAQGHVVKDLENQESESFTSNPIQMFELINFLDKLQEQPIIVEFRQYHETNLGIMLTGFTHMI